MSETEETKGRTRWFQFGLRELFLLLTAIGVILALEFGRDVRRPSSARKLREAVQVGEEVRVYGTVFDTTWHKLEELAHGRITEIGEDFIVIGRDELIPLANVGRIVRIPSSPPPQPVGVAKGGGGMGGGGGMPGGGGPGGGFPGGAGGMPGGAGGMPGGASGMPGGGGSMPGGGMPGGGTVRPANTPASSMLSEKGSGAGKTKESVTTPK